MNQIPTIEEVTDFIRSLFGHRSKSGQAVTLDTPCNDLFHNDIDGVDLCIGGPIEKKFDLSMFSFKYGLASHQYGAHLGRHEADFYRQFPREMLSGPNFTLKKFAEMVHRLIEIKHELA